MKMAGRWLLSPCLWPILLLKSVIHRWYWKKVVKMFFLNSLLFSICMLCLQCDVIAAFTHKLCFMSTSQNPDTRIKCWQFMFLQATVTLTCVRVIGCVPYWHFYDQCHFIFTWSCLWSDYHVGSWRWWWWSYRPEGWQVCDLDICKCETVLCLQCL